MGILDSGVLGRIARRAMAGRIPVVSCPASAQSEEPSEQAVVLPAAVVFAAQREVAPSEHVGKKVGEPNAGNPHVRFCRGSRPKRNSL